jgi:hypothetical protein
MINKNTRFELLKETIKQSIREHEEHRENIECTGLIEAHITHTMNGMIAEARTILYLIDRIENIPIKKVRKELKEMGGKGVRE